jgi:hypothetical protein
MDNGKRETINKSIYCLTMMNPILKKEKGNKTQKTPAEKLSWRGLSFSRKALCLYQELPKE